MSAFEAVGSGSGGASTPELDAYVAEVLSDSPVGFWKMDEVRGFPQDSSGNGNHMTDGPYDGRRVWRAPGPMPGSYAIRLLGGAANYFSRSVVTTEVDDISMEMWFAEEYHANNDRLFYNGDFDTDPGWGLDLYDFGPQFQALVGGIGFQAQSVNTVSYGWHQLVIVRGGGVWTYYFDGALDTANAGTDTPNTPTVATWIGSNGAVQGSFAMCAIYETALSLTQVGDHYAAAGF